ncbi:MAG: class I SAM-dependent methyltransferase [Candidatus Methanoperedens sp.]|nr:class I SAM-dependent methyltransferase [Candidatus Methanoperedens sp.]MCZ7371597.1 class I SAM-dependent methyltransferase [Candidatus Methanoperedens sp.]
MAHKFNPQNAGILDSPDRIRILNPESILDRLTRDMILVDLGCGTGYFSIPASMKVKKVFALDVQQEMLDSLGDKIKKENITNIETILSGESSIPLPDNSAHVLLMVNVFHELEDREAILREGRRILFSGGKLMIIDWKKMQMDFGPPVEERLTPDEIISICKDNGFELKEESDAGPYNYLLVFEKPGKRIEETEDKHFHGERKQYSDIDDLIKKTLEDRKKRRSQQLKH